MVLGMQIVKFSDMLEDMFVELAPNRITEYLYELANLFTSFYKDCKVSLLPCGRHWCWLSPSTHVMAVL